MARVSPDYDTLGFHGCIGQVTSASVGLEQEITCALLAAPLQFEYTDLNALESSVRVRRNIAVAAQRTALAFKTAAAERPMEYWRDDDDHGYVLRSGSDLIAALQAATQPEVTGRLYDFSCYRASEYVMLLGLAQELSVNHHNLYMQLQKRCEQQVIRSAQFHDVFLVEHGSTEQPLPPCYYVPGDRVWFRNPDPQSSDASGFEGSWVIYLGGGLFSNFWKRDKPFTIEDKCLEIHHWRDAVWKDSEGEPRIDEAHVDVLCAQTRQNPARHRAVLDAMLRLRDPSGVYADGGCIDRTREVPRSVAPGSCELVIPALEPTVAPVKVQHETAKPN